MRKYLTYILGFLVFFLPLGLYIKTLAPTYIPIDSAEFTMCMYTWGVCHPPGFPLYVALGHFFLKLIPFGTIIWRANLFSAVFGALTALVVYLSFLKLKVEHLTAFLLVILLSVSSTFWEFSLSADVFTFGTFLVALAFYLAFWNRKYLAFFVLGLSASHFYLTAVLWPFFWWYLEGEGAREPEASKGAKVSNVSKVKDLFVCGVIFGLGLFPQIMMFVRMQANPIVNWGHVKNLGEFIDFVRRREFGSGFLISNPSLLYSPVKNFWQIVVYLRSLLFEFGLILPISTLLMFFLKTRENGRQFLFLFYSFLILVFVQLFLLSTIDPVDPNNPFQLNKFYLYSFVLVILMVGMALEGLRHKFFDENFYMLQVFIVIFTLIYLVVNFKTHDFSRNYFSQKFVNDLYSELPSNAVAVTVDHLVYFGGLYEQQVDNKYKGVKILYYPNEKNHDQEAYFPELFSGTTDEKLISDVKRDFNIGGSEDRVLSLVAKNRDRNIYFALGDFEFQFFKFLKNETEPYGLWLYVKHGEAASYQKLLEMTGSFQNKDIKKADFWLRQQASETSAYSIGYYYSGLELAKRGDWDGAIELFGRSLSVNSVGVSVGNDLELVKKIKRLMASYDSIFKSRDSGVLADLGQALFTVGNWQECAKVYEDLLSFKRDDATIYNNAASAYANLGNVKLAREYYQDALKLDSNLQIAKDGLAKLGD